ncbi:glycosyltransferase family 2 protein [Cohnella xylanilytica]|uniref:Glycosyltransferase family 2 protein n=1 Tax=Cohnella xylanilytica TaxID=557555 RepID=A0A841U9L7_9BACL|nr:glycosyltransferase family A protein [Cohnella xylanilytica]MBB6694630.1 glycosyltransferase family 2 protein [Cohnella xylanilytica]
MTAPLFSIVVPTYRNGRLLRYALDSVRNQSLSDYEVFVVCDSAVEEGREIAFEFARRDSRFRVLDRPKGARHGEAYRHEVLLAARGRYVGYLCDDDLWLPDHLRRMGQALERAEFVHSLYAFFQGGRLSVFRNALEDPAIRELMLEQPFNIFGPTAASHRLDTYFRLPEGWAPGPEGVWSDLNMWRKFLRLEHVVLSTVPEITSVSFPSSLRPSMTLEQREKETAYWAELIVSPAIRDILREAEVSPHPGGGDDTDSPSSE